VHQKALAVTRGNWEPVRRPKQQIVWARMRVERVRYKRNRAVPRAAKGSGRCGAIPLGPRWPMARSLTALSILQGSDAFPLQGLLNFVPWQLAGHGLRQRVAEATLLLDVL
jgi:hypothetical protein